MVVGNCVEDHIRQRIDNGEYVDFSRLLPRDRLTMEEDNRMEIINKNRKTYFVPAAAIDPNGISNFSCWEQAFRVFSNIYTRKFPGRASELIQYNHIIHTAALSFTWENVYLYDRDFRMHLSRYPNRSWSVILQQAWTMRLKDRNMIIRVRELIQGVVAKGKTRIYAGDTIVDVTHLGNHANLNISVLSVINLVMECISTGRLMVVTTTTMTMEVIMEMVIMGRVVAAVGITTQITIKENQRTSTKSMIIKAITKTTGSESMLHCDRNLGNEES